jgi:hypothetical protein
MMIDQVVLDEISPRNFHMGRISLGECGRLWILYSLSFLDTKHCRSAWVADATIFREID